MAASWEHLLGGYATHTLTDEEKRQLYEAALNDQALFNALADEEALKVMLADPEARRRILASLEATERSGGVPDEKVKWVSWLKEHTSLAWAGSIAAVGLALIFGWQMEKEWGPVVSQEQEAAKSSSREELPFRTQKPSDEGTSSLQKEALETKPAQEEAIEIEGERQGRTKTENDARESGLAMRRQRTHEQVTQSPPAPSALIQPKDGRSVQPLSVPEAPEVPMTDKVPQATAPGRMADQAMDEATQLPPSAQELFYAASGSLGDEVIGEKNDVDREDQAHRGALSKTIKPLEGDFSGGAAMPIARGLRYSFVQQAKEGKDEEMEIRQVAGNWSEIRLAVESNVSGYLYVLAPLGNGKWQNLVPMESDKTEQTEVGIKVKSFQRVEFPLTQLTDNSNKSVAPSLTVLLSLMPLNDLGQWLESKVDMSEFQVERVEGAVFVVQPTLGKENPLHVVVSLMK
ncbi:hypothetical protein ACTRXD_20295 [Nitrospira sp. T9]|uniref:hypothetical protein n=1 Tax=unclassified Nitrospira TaxID=2652172 RepID=UPI003F9EB391